MKQKKPFYTSWWFWVIVVIVFMSFITPKKETAPAEETKAEVVEEPQEEQDPIVSMVDSLKMEYSDLSYETTGDTLNISLHYDGAFWDETDFVRSCLTHYINLCKQAYEMEGIETLDYTVNVDLIDPKGNEVPERALEFSMPKSTFSTYNWDNMKLKTDSFNQIDADAQIYIHPGIRQNLNYSKVFYKG